MTITNLFDVDDKVTVFDQSGIITEVIDQTKKPHLYTVMFDETGKTYTIEHYHIKPVRDTRPVTERIKTLEDAIAEIGEEHALVKALRLYEAQMHGNYDDMADIYAYLKLRIITAALNEGWEPDFWDAEQHKYWARMRSLSVEEHNWFVDSEEEHNCCTYDANGERFIYALSSSAQSFSTVSRASRLAFKSRELAVYACRHFKDIYADFYYK